MSNVWVVRDLPSLRCTRRRRVMIRASGLYGRAIIDLDTAERVGSVDEVIVDPYGPGIAGFVVTCDRSLIGARKRIIVPMEAIHAIGPDALTLRSVGHSGE